MIRLGRRGWSVALVVGIGLVLPVSVANAQEPARADDAQTVPEGRRVLVISVPGLTWQDVNEEHLPNLQSLLDASAVANVSLRVERMATLAGEGYATLGSGTRAVAPLALAGMGFGAAEPFGSGAATDELRRQLGFPPEGEVLHLGWHDLARRNR